MALYIMSVGGSLIVPEEIDTEFLASFKQFIIKRIEKGDRFILIAGGGKTCRKYQKAAAEVAGIDNEEKDWLGIHSSRLNGHLLRTIFKLHAHPKLVTNYDLDLKEIGTEFKENILVGAGWKPGWSTDYDAVLMAKQFGATTIINLSNIDYVYTDDPRVNPEAQKLENIKWKDFQAMIGSKWDPGMNAPFDPIASKEAAANNYTVAILNGKNLANIYNFMEGKKFKGTIIKN